MNKIISRLKYIKLSDIKHIFLFFLALPFAFLFKQKHKDLWLITEDGTMARDNGYWLFKYLCELHPEIDCAFVITKDSPDFKKIYNLGKIVPAFTFKHWIYYISASKNISSTKLGKPSSAVCFPLEQLGILKSKRIFLQHGITKDDMPTLYFSPCKFSIFVTAAKREFNFVENTFGYSGKNIVKLLGFCRYDNLMNFKYIYKKNQILIMPTWRDWLGNASLHLSNKIFVESDYYKTYQSLLKNKTLCSFIESKGLKIVFFPHKSMQKFISNFESCSANITVADWHNYDVQQLLMESAFLITDYSSIFFDFAYMKKPLVYYQFDYERFRAGHYEEGYFSYLNDGFGEICKTETELISLIISYAESGFKMNDKYENRIKDFFAFSDNKNCERTFEAISDINNVHI